MEPQEKICILCLKTGDNFKAVDEHMKDALDLLVPRMDFAAIQKPVICTNCSKILIKCFDFKAACFCVRDYILPLVNNKNVKLNLTDAYLGKNVNGTGVSENQVICVFCTNPVEKYSAISVDVAKGDDMLKNMMEKCLPELNLCIIEEPMICAPCHGSLENCFHFVTSCLIVEEKIKKYRETFNVNSTDPIELSRLLQFTIRDITTSKVDGSSVDVIKAEKQLCEEIENAGKRDGIFKLEQMYCEANENPTEEIEHKSYVDMADLISNDLLLQDVLVCKEECSNFDVIKTEETFCTEREPKQEHLVETEDQKFLLKEEIEIKADELDSGRFEDGTVLHQSKVTTRVRESLMSDLEEDLSKPYIHENVIKTKMYQCDGCSFQTKSNHYLKSHLLKHKDPLEVTMYKCDFCSYQSAQKQVLKTHLIVHKDPSEVTMYKCVSCSFQTKYKGSFKNHLLVHKSPSETTVHKCNSCPYQTVQKHVLKMHLLVHKDPSEITMYNCDSCLFHTKHRGSYKKHILLHKDPSEVIMHKCDSCSYQTRQKCDLNRHLLVHKDPSEITMHKCDFCSYQTKQKSDLKKHLLVHKDQSEETMHKHDACSYQTEQKDDLVHKSPSEVTMYKCDSCSYQTGHKSYLKSHLLVHRSPSEVTMYKCDYCSFQTKLKQNLTTHLLVHKSPSEVKMYKCDSCSFQTKYKDNLRKHSLLHKDPSDVSVYKCHYCSFHTKRKYFLSIHELAHKKSKKTTID